MLTIKQQFITDKLGHQIGVLLPIEKYKKMVDEIEELADIKAFDLAISKSEPTIPLREAIKLRKQKNG